MMPLLVHDHRGAPEPARSRPLPRRPGAVPVLALQRALGNRATTRVLARKGPAGASFENSVRIGKLGPIEITESNIALWIGKKADADDLDVTSVKGKHSGELKRLAESRTRLDKIEVQSIVGENSWVIITFKNARIRGYTADDAGKTEHWKAVDFDGVDITRTAIGTPRP